MRSALLIVLLGCAGPSRPVRQLKTNEWMFGGNISAPGARGLPDLSTWVRYAPWTYFDLTAGATAGIPVQGAWVSTFGELRIHIPMGPFRLMLAGEAEVGGLKQEDDDWYRVHRYLGSGRLVLDAFRTKVYLGTRGGFLSNLKKIPGDLISAIGLRRDGEGRLCVGPSAGVEHMTIDGWTLGGVIDFLVLFHPESREKDGGGFVASFYVGW
jgi:hypothetical protein